MAHSLLEIWGLYGDKSLDWHRFQIRLILPYGCGCVIHWHQFTIRRVQRCDVTCSAMPTGCILFSKPFTSWLSSYTFWESVCSNLCSYKQLQLKYGLSIVSKVKVHVPKWYTTMTSNIYMCFSFPLNLLQRIGYNLVNYLFLRTVASISCKTQKLCYFNER